MCISVWHLILKCNVLGGTQRILKAGKRIRLHHMRSVARVQSDGFNIFQIVVCFVLDKNKVR